MLLKRDETLFILVDVQGKLAEIVHESEQLLINLQRFIRGLRTLNVPIIWLEQYPEGLGPTNPKISEQLTDLKPIAKVSFSAYENDQFVKLVQKHNRSQLLIAGIETHICVYQTAVDLKENGYDVQVVEDAVSSRTLANKEAGLRKMNSLGIYSTTVEMALYELLKTAEDEHFKEILKIIK